MLGSGIRDSEPDTDLSLAMKSVLQVRKPVAEAWFVTTNAVLAKVDPSHGPTQAAAIVNRVYRETPPVSRRDATEFASFCAAWIDAHTQPINPSDMLTFEEWLEGTQYTLAEKAKITAAVDEQFPKRHDPKLRKRKAFVKDEEYAKINHARLICAGEDLFKGIFGPYWKVVENQIFSLPHFAKHIPRVDLADALVGLAAKVMPILIEGDDCIYFDGTLYLVGDFESYESLLVVALTRAIERRALRRIHLHTLSEDLALLADEVYGWDGRPTTVHTNQVQAKGPARRFSGDNQTSLGNGLANFLIWLFIQSNNLPITPDTFLRYGFRIKLSTHDSGSSASFCGVICDQYERQLVKNPVPVLLKFGWSKKHQIGFSDKKVKSMLRVKALSLAYEHPGCPILSAFAGSVLRLTAGSGLRGVWKHLTYWEREKLSAALRVPIVLEPPGPRTRLLVEEQFDISVATQLRVEEYFDKVEDLKPFDVDALGLSVPDWSRRLFCDYTGHYPYREDWIENCPIPSKVAGKLAHSSVRK